MIWMYEWAIKAGFKLVIAIVVLIAVVLLYLVTARGAEARDAAVGDSIALGTGHALQVPTQARVGAGSCEISRYATLRTRWGHLAISAGINDRGACVAELRALVKARRVTWIVPANINPGAAAVWAQVKLYGDGFVTYTCKGGCSKTNFHPASYAAVARAVRRDWNTYR